VNKQAVGMQPVFEAALPPTVTAGTQGTGFASI
jgi:hypothetical protein